MGGTKNAMVKRASKKMLEEENVFTTGFDNNKKVLGSSMPSKKVRNKIAGYLVRLRVLQKKDKVKIQE